MVKACSDDSDVLPKVVGPSVHHPSMFVEYGDHVRNKHTLTKKFFVLLQEFI